MTKPTCPRCGREKSEGAAFCLDCGQQFGLERPTTTSALCAACGAHLQPGFRFCGVCGTPLGSSARTPRQGAAAVASDEGANPGAAVSSPSLRTTPGPIRLSLTRNDGTPGPIFSVEKDEAVCGRTDGEIRLPDDPSVSPRHARFTLTGGVLRVQDLGSVNGTFLRLREPRRLSVGEEVRVGRQLLRLEPLPRPHAEEQAVRPWGTKDLGYRFRLSQLLERGGLGDIFPLRDGQNLVGREAGDVTFPSDRYVSARHAQIEISGDDVMLTDTGSSNGTYVKIAGAAELAAGDQLLVGTQLLRVEG